MSTDLRSFSYPWAALEKEIEALRERQEESSHPIEKVAHTLLTTRKMYRRSGMFPALIETDDNGCVFLVSNGYDTGDDFTVRLGWTELVS